MKITQQIVELGSEHKPSGSGDPRSYQLEERTLRTITGAWDELRPSSPSLINLWQVGLRSVHLGVKTAPSWNFMVPSLHWSRESSIDPIRLQRAESGKLAELSLPGEEWEYCWIQPVTFVPISKMKIPSSSLGHIIHGSPPVEAMGSISLHGDNLDPE